MDSALEFKSKCITMPTLYKQTKTGKTQVWSILMEFINNTTKEPIKPKKDYETDAPKKHNAIIKTTYGQKDGKMQESAIIIDAGKNIGRSNETNIFKQGILEMTSRWKKQQERLGYSLSETESEVVKIRPMLLHEYKKHFKYIDFKDAWIQEKMDGTRVMVNINDRGEVILMSRQGKPFCHLNHIRADIKTLGLKKGLYLDGELYSRDLNFNEIMSICRTEIISAKDQKEFLTAQADIKLYVFDLLDLSDESRPFTERFKDLTKLLIKPRDSIVIVHTERVKNDADVQRIYNKFLKERNAEGAVIRDGQSKYLIGKRSHYALKLKPEDDAEFLIVGFKEGRGKDKGAIIFEMETDNDKRFDARPATTYEERVKMFKEGNKYIGQKGTVKYMGLTPDGVPRFPVFKGVRDS